MILFGKEERRGKVTFLRCLADEVEQQTRCGGYLSIRSGRCEYRNLLCPDGTHECKRPRVWIERLKEP